MQENFKDCVAVEPYTDSSDQWWTRLGSSATAWTLQTLDPSGVGMRHPCARTRRAWL
jgi:hypothetical protein